MADEIGLAEDTDSCAVIIAHDDKPDRRSGKREQGQACEDKQTPHDLDTIADLRRLPDLLRQRGYDADAVRGILYGNWARFFREAWGG